MPFPWGKLKINKYVCNGRSGGDKIYKDTKQREKPERDGKRYHSEVCLGEGHLNKDLNSSEGVTHASFSAI